MADGGERVSRGGMDEAGEAHVEFQGVGKTYDGRAMWSCAILICARGGASS